MTAQRLTTVRFARGFGLIELMIGIVLGSFLLLGLSEVFSASRTAYNTAQGSAEVQESGRFALDFLQRDARMVGHMGCINDQSRFLAPQPEFFTHFIATPAPYTSANNAGVPFAERFDVAVQGFEASNTAPTSGQMNLPLPTAAGVWGGTPALPGGFPGAGMPAPLPNSDILVLRFFGTSSAPVTSIVGNVITAPAFATEATAEPSGMYGIANCINASVFEATSVGAGGVITATGGGNLSNFGTAAGGAGDLYAATELSIYQAESMAYYVALPPGRTVPSLYRIHYTSNPTAPVAEEIVEGIDNMQLLYGRDNNASALPDGAIDEYDTAATINALNPADPSAYWRRVGTVRIALLARSMTLGNTAANAVNSPNGCTTAANCYSMLGLPVIPPPTAAGALDSNYREVYVTTIAMRNRLFGN
jgi:type IV pilus assembly protein PilW